MKTSQAKSVQNPEQPTLEPLDIEYTHALTEAQSRLGALIATFNLFVGKDKEPDILGLQCVIDDADRLAGTVRHIYNLSKTNKVAQQPKPTQPAQSETDKTGEPNSLVPAIKDEPAIDAHDESICIFAPDFSHRHLCDNEPDAFDFFQTIRRTVATTKSILSLNRAVSDNASFNRDDAYYSLIAAQMNIDDIQAVNQAMREYAPTCADVYDSIDEMTGRALAELIPLCNLLAEDEPIQAGLVKNSLDSIIETIEKLKMVEADSGLGKNQA